MGMSVGGSKGGGGRRRRGGRKAVMSEINVTPFVDVMLVLLIIFMVAAPMMTVGVPLDLPKTSAKALNAETQPITVSVKADGAVFLQETAIPAEEIAAKLEAVATTGYTERIFVRGAHVRGGYAERARQGMGEVVRAPLIGTACARALSALPNRMTISTRNAHKPPARQSFATVPLALRDMLDCARRRALQEPAEQPLRHAQLLRPERMRMPLLRC